MPSRNGTQPVGGGISVRAVVILLLLSNALVYQLTTLRAGDVLGTIHNHHSSGASSGGSSLETLQSFAISAAQRAVAAALGDWQRNNDTSSSSAATEPEKEIQPQTTQSSTITATTSITDDGSAPRYALEIPRGEATALPSVRITQEEESQGPDRKIYGGKGDKAHLGGFTEIDIHGISPSVWKDMVEWFGVKSLLDVGCGRGISTSWFVLNGVDTLCVEGSHDAVERTMLPDPSIITEHDFSRGPWWPKRTVDAVWSVELLEHIGRNYMQNYIPAFRKAALLFVTSSRWGGWHHVEVHMDDWWIAKFQSYGFVYSEEMTKRVKKKAAMDRGKGPTPAGDIGDKVAGDKYYPQHILMSMKVFINPAVASLPEHQHLFAELGCYHSRKDGEIIHRPCGEKRFAGKESILPKEFHPIEVTTEGYQKWFDHVVKNLNATKLR